MSIFKAEVLKELSIYANIKENIYDKLYGVHVSIGEQVVIQGMFCADDIRNEIRRVRSPLVGRDLVKDVVRPHD